MITDNKKIKEIESKEEVPKEDKEFVKRHTYLSNEEIYMINQTGINIIKDLHSVGMSCQNITDFISGVFEFHEKKQKAEMKVKINTEIEAKNFKENISFNGKEFVYEKFVVIDSYKAVIDKKTFKSKSNYIQWVRMNKKLASKKNHQKNK